MAGREGGPSYARRQALGRGGGGGKCQRTREHRVASGFAPARGEGVIAGAYESVIAGAYKRDPAGRYDEEPPANREDSTEATGTSRRRRGPLTPVVAVRVAEGTLRERRRQAAHATAMLLLSVLALIAACDLQARAHAPGIAFAQFPEPLPLTHEGPQTLRIATGETHRFSLDLPAGRYV